MLLPAVAFNPGIFLDSTFRVIGSSDATKKIAFEVDAQSTGAVLTFNTGAQTTGRSLTAPVLTGNRTLAVIDQAQTFSALTTHSAGLTVSSGTTAVQALTATSITNSGLTSGRVPFSSTGGLQADSSGLLFATTGAGQLTVGSGTGQAIHRVNGGANTSTGFKWQSGGLDRWNWYTNGAESGSNAGGNLTLANYDDAGSLITAALLVVTRSSGLLTYAGPVTLSTASTGLTIAATSGTTLTVSSTSATAISCAGGAAFGDTLSGSRSTNGAYVGLSLANASTGTSARTDWSFIANDNTFSILAHGSTYTAVANRTGRMVFSAPSTSAGFRWETGASASPGDFVFAAKGTTRLTVGASVVCNAAALATTATSGFLYVPTCAGAPTGVPATETGSAPIVVDTTNHKLYFYSGGAWRDAGP